MRAIDAFATCGTVVVLSGHLHSWRAEPFAATAGPRASVLQVQAGAGLSIRQRGKENDFNLLTLEPGQVIVESFVASTRSGAFQRAFAVAFERGPAGWRPSERGDPSAASAMDARGVGFA